MKPLQLLDTPFLVFQKIIKLMEIIDLFEMSQTSKRMFACIKNARRRVQPIFLFKMENGRMIRVADCEKNGLDPEFDIVLTSENVEKDVLRQLRVKETIFDVCEKNEKSLSCCLHNGLKEEDIDSQLVDLFNYLSDLFNNKTVTVWLRPSHIATSSFLFSNLKFETCQLIKIIAKSDILSNDGVSRILEILKPTIGIALKCHIEKGFGPKNILNLPRLYIFKARWITFDDLLNMECETAFLRHHSFTEEDVKKLRGFKMTPNWEHILEGINYGVWDEKEKKKRPRIFQDHYIYRVKEIDCKNGLDFERKSDGMIGTVMHQSDQIDFFVWHDIQF
ncbi:hypothetical protein GCK72_004529 [Caenorhabditis remanei]|uniref:F-box domain-containing protein n=1 Tax=Caenorhabditis remanei TaxID=31234 RepID=A0A6A5H9U6_CAERE|nr:hypothetical protein GCK72_004529 [Caenorhabditis remanei]KAF1764580.1 hypothetical protein GCK72_004529 [Caenorhabditis remanei]